MRVRLWTCITAASLVAAPLPASDAEAKGFRLRFAPRVHLPGSYGPTGQKVYSANTLNQFQIEKCLRWERDSDVISDQVEESERSLSALESELKDLKARIGAERATINRYSQTSIDQFNRIIDNYEAKRAVFNSLVDGHNVIVRKANDLGGDFNRECSGKLYYEDDMAAARQAVGSTR